MVLRDLTVLTAATILFSPVAVVSGDTAAEMLTRLEAPDWGDREATLKRFSFLLDEFGKACPPEGAPPHDMLVFIHGELDKLGLGREESLLSLANTLYPMTNDIYRAATMASMAPPKCAEIWFMYYVARKDGHSQERAREIVTAFVRSLYGLMTK